MKTSNIKRNFIIVVVCLFFGSIFLQSCHTPTKLLAETQPFQNFIPIVLIDEGEREGFSSFGPDGGTIGSIEIDPNNADIVYAGTWGNGIYKSPDRGVTWFNVSQGFVSGFVFDIAVDPDNSMNLIASAYEKGAYFSRDGGKNWIASSGMPDITVVYDFAYDPNDTDIVYAAVREKTIYSPEPHYPGGIYRSLDGGKSWVKWSSGLPEDYVYDVLVDPNNINILYAGFHKAGVYKSTNGGKSWFSVNNNIHYRDVRSLDINPNNGTLYAGLYDGRGVAFTRDGGATWNRIESSITQSLYVYTLALNPKDYTSLYLTGPDGIYRCAGNPYPSETSACSRIAHAGIYVFDVALDKTSSIIYSGLQDACLYKSTDNGASFKPSYAGVKANVITSVVSDPGNPAIFYVSAVGRGLFKSTDQGSSWTMLTNGAPTSNVNQLILRPGNSSVIYAATQKEGIFMSSNAGSSWTPINQGLSSLALDGLGEKGGLPAEGFDHHAYSWMDPVDIEAMRKPIESLESKDRVSYPEILSIGIDSSNTTRMIAGTKGFGILKSNDSGSTWTTTGVSSGNVYDFMVDLDQSNYIYYAGVLDAGIRRSDASRNSWPVANTGMHAGADVYGIALGSPSVYYAASDSGVYKTTNAAVSWTQMGLSGVTLTDIFVYPLNQNIIFSTSMHGLYQSSDAGLTWQNVGENLLNDRFLNIALGYGFDSVYFGMSGGNIYRFGD